MLHESDLSLAFVRRRPGSAAVVVAAQPAAEAAVFLETIPVRSADELLTRMQSRSAAAIVDCMNPEFASDVLRNMDFVIAASILRLLAGKQREALLETLPAGRRRAFESSLSFAEDTVGAHMTTSIDALASTNTVADALRSKRDGDRNASDLVFVVDENQRFSGVVPLIALVRSPEDTRLSAVVDTSCVSVSPYLRLSEISGLDAWCDYGGLPVVSRRLELLGAIERRALRAAKRAGASAGPAGHSSIAGSTLAMMGHGALNLIDVLVPTDSTDKSHGADDGR